MCGRYQLGLEGKNKLFGYRFDVDETQISNLSDNYNITPDSVMPTIVRQSPNQLVMMKWGLIPNWSKDGKSLVINARSETIAEKPMFKSLLNKRRCLIPTTGFYEWQKTKTDKIPFFIGLKNKDFFSFAGLYDVWKNHNGEEIKTYVIITCQPNNMMAPIHNRMPVIFSKDEENIWLNKSIVDVDSLVTLLNPLEDEKLIAYPISKRINNPENNDNLLTTSIDTPI